jgi:hypothetical protein
MITVEDAVIEEYFSKRDIKTWILSYMKLETDICERCATVPATDTIMVQLRAIVGEAVHKITHDHEKDITMMLTKLEKDLQADKLDKYQRDSTNKLNVDAIVSNLRDVFDERHHQLTSIMSTIKADQEREINSILTKLQVEKHEDREKYRTELVNLFDNQKSDLHATNNAILKMNDTLDTKCQRIADIVNSVGQAHDTNSAILKLNDNMDTRCQRITDLISSVGQAHDQDIASILARLDRDVASQTQEHNKQISKLIDAQNSLHINFIDAMNAISTQSADTKMLLRKFVEGQKTQEEQLVATLQTLNANEESQTQNYIECIHETVANTRDMEKDEYQKIARSTIDNVVTHVERMMRETTNTSVMHGLGEIRDKIIQDQASRDLVSRQIESMTAATNLQTKTLTDLLGSTERVAEWVDRINGKNSSVKGSAAQDAYVDMLNRHFEADVTDVGGTPESCDIDFDMNDRPPIRVEIKNYSSKNIPTTEVRKFHNDLEQCGRHGIMISVNSHIAKKSDFTFDLVGDQQKFVAFYISKNGLDMDRFESALRFVYSLAQVMDTQTESCANSYTADEVQRMCDRMQLHQRRIDDLKEMHKRAIQMLADMSTGDLVDLLQKRHKPVDVTAVKKYVCVCGKGFTQKSNFSTHKKTCAEHQQTKA